MHRPGPYSEIVGSPRAAAVLMWCALPALGVFGLTRATAVSLVLGTLFLLLGGVGLASTVRSRVWVEGAVLRYRTLLGDRPPVRLDRLTRAHLTRFDRGTGRQLRLADADGAAVEIDATNLRIQRLYEVLAHHLRPADPVANDLLHRRMRKYQSDLPFGGISRPPRR